MDYLKETINNIKHLDTSAINDCQKRLDSLTKPKGSLGVLEDIAKKISGIYGTSNLRKEKKVVIIMASDHGVVEEGISGYPQEVTQQMVLNMLNHGAGINVLLDINKGDFALVDIGVAGEINNVNLINRKIKYGTDNMAKGPAMSRIEAVKAIEAGIDIAKGQVKKGAKVLATGEMGIGNTTPSSAILKLFSGLDTELIVGPGAGINEERLKKKREVIDKSIALNKPNKDDAIDVLAKVGGLEIAGLAGVIIGAAACRVPVVLDGFISTAAALIAYKLAPLTREYMIPSHSSEEPGHKWMMKLLDLQPYLNLKFRLGEGTGAAMAFNVIDAAVSILNNMATFADAGVSKENK